MLPCSHRGTHAQTTHTATLQAHADLCARTNLQTCSVIARTRTNVLRNFQCFHLVFFYKSNCIDPRACQSFAKSVRDNSSTLLKKKSTTENTFHKFGHNFVTSPFFSAMFRFPKMIWSVEWNIKIPHCVEQIWLNLDSLRLKYHAHLCF